MNVVSVLARVITESKFSAQCDFFTVSKQKRNILKMNLCKFQLLSGWCVVYKLAVPLVRK